MFAAFYAGALYGSAGYGARGNTVYTVPFSEAITAVDSNTSLALIKPIVIENITSSDGNSILLSAVCSYTEIITGNDAIAVYFSLAAALAETLALSDLLSTLSLAADIVLESLVASDGNSIITLANANLAENIASAYMLTLHELHPLDLFAFEAELRKLIMLAEKRLLEACGYKTPPAKSDTRSLAGDVEHRGGKSSDDRLF